jgi:hypothetical protein
MTLQENYLYKAITEACLKYTHLATDHRNAANYIDGKEYPLLFPKSLFDLCQGNEKRIYQYYFKGEITPQRSWIIKFKNEFSIIEHSEHGRDDNIKFEYDKDYFKGLKRSLFALCPIGECKWLYRLFEAVMCGCIPVIEEQDMFHNVFFHYHCGEKMEYSEQRAKENLKILKSRFTIN